MITLKSSGTTPVQKLAGAIAANIRQGQSCEISVVGAEALNQAIKACIVCRRFLKLDDVKKDFTIQPQFRLTKYSEPSNEVKEITTIILLVRPCQYDETYSVPINEDN